VLQKGVTRTQYVPPYVPPFLIFFFASFFFVVNQTAPLFRVPVV